MDTRAWAANNLAARLLARPWTVSAIAQTLDAVLAYIHPRTRRALATRLAPLGQRYPPAPRALADFLTGCEYFRPARDRAVDTVFDPPRFAPAPPFDTLPVPPLATVLELADWLGQTPEQLDWLADVRRAQGRASHSPLQHYRYHFIGKADGGRRLIEAPKTRLKSIQRQILREILAAAPVHACANGFVTGRSCLTGARVHAGEAVVATYDLRQFFPTIGLARIHGLFRRFGYPWAVSLRLAGLCTTMTPTGVFRALPPARRPDWATQALLRAPHLPQGAPTSPALANLLAWSLDRRLHGLARAAGANYTRYADDLAFSGGPEFAAGLHRFRDTMATIVAEEGFALNDGKMRVMPHSTRQRVTGIVVNEHCNIGRAEFDALKATLHNCVRAGPKGQNRAGAPDFRAHLGGRVGWVEQVNPRRGQRLRALFDQIDWGPDSVAPAAAPGSPPGR